MSIVWSQPAAFTVLVFIIIFSEVYEVEARPKEVLPIPGWFNNVEGFVIPNLKRIREPDLQTTDTTILKHRHVKNFDSAEDGKIKIKKKKKKLADGNTKRIQDEETKNFETTKMKKKKKKKRKKQKTIFVKSKVTDKDNNSIMSGSKETKKPVDIIVHIKMNNN